MRKRNSAVRRDVAFLGIAGVCMRVIAKPVEPLSQCTLRVRGTFNLDSCTRLPRVHLFSRRLNGVLLKRLLEEFVNVPSLNLQIIASHSFGTS